MFVLEAVFAALAGLAFGSFANVCACRVPAGESFLWGRSRCPSCGTSLAPRDLVPVLSYALLRGRCRYCGARISPRDPAVEALMAAAWLLFFLVYRLSPSFFVDAAFVFLLVVVALIDHDHGDIYVGFDLAIGAAGLAACLLSGPGWAAHPLGLLAAGLPLLMAAVLSRGGMGLGDVEFAAACGLVVGWQNALLALLAASASAAAVGIFRVLCKKADWKTPLRFAPFLAAGFGVSALAGRQIVRAYLGLFLR